MTVNAFLPIAVKENLDRYWGDIVDRVGRLFFIFGRLREIVGLWVLVSSPDFQATAQEHIYGDSAHIPTGSSGHTLCSL
jgi:hypothetical protein